MSETVVQSPNIRVNNNHDCQQANIAHKGATSLFLDADFLIMGHTFAVSHAGSYMMNYIDDVAVDIEAVALVSGLGGTEDL